jgi:hypothetical protein
MSLHHVFDAAYPPTTKPSSCDGVLGYIGGARALRVWTHEEWLRFESIRQFPCWVPRGNENPVTDAKNAVAEANKLGWVSWDGSRVIVCDLETLELPSWYHQWAEEVNNGGYYAVAYGSASTVTANKASNVWVAKYDGSQALPSGTHGHQYAEDIRFSNTEVDYSVVDDWLFDRGGVGSRH